MSDFETRIFVRNLELLARIGIRAREQRQGEVEPAQPTPGDRAVDKARKAGWLPLRFRLAGGTRSG